MASTNASRLYNAGSSQAASWAVARVHLGWRAQVPGRREFQQPHHAWASAPSSGSRFGEGSGGLEGADDPAVLDWAAQHGRVLLTHDVRTIRPFAEERIRQGLPMAGVVFVPQPFSRSQIIDDMAILAGCGKAHEFSDQWLYLPLS